MSVYLNGVDITRWQAAKARLVEVWKRLKKWTGRLIDTMGTD